MSEIQAEGLSTAATNPNITNDSKNIAANAGEEGSFRNPQTEERQPGNTSGNGSAGNGGATSVGAAPSNGDETPGHEKKAPKGSLSGGTGFEKPQNDRGQLKWNMRRTREKDSPRGYTWIGLSNNTRACSH